MVQDALAKKNDFELIFLPWSLMPEYSMPFSGEEEKKKFAETLDAYEKDIQKGFNLKLEQLNWRRWAIKNKCGGDLDKFKQELEDDKYTQRVNQAENSIGNKNSRYKDLIDQLPIRVVTSTTRSSGASGYPKPISTNTCASTSSSQSGGGQVPPSAITRPYALDER